MGTPSIPLDIPDEQLRSVRLRAVPGGDRTIEPDVEVYIAGKDDRAAGDAPQAEDEQPGAA